MTILIRRLPLLSAAIASALLSAQAGAQQAPAASSSAGELGEIVVTARAREEKLVDVPATVQAFTANDIKRAGIERPQDFIALTPGVSQVQTAEVGDLQVSIRGINTGRDAETNFALVIDGVLQTNPNGFNQEFANIDQIEVVKGPQSAIYGRNAVSGAMIINTHKPTDETEFDATVGGGNKGTEKANVYFSGKIADGVDAGVSAFYRNTNGFFYNSYLKCDSCADYYKEEGIAPRMIVDAGENGTFDIKAKYSKITAGAINFNAVFALPAFASGLSFLNGNGYNSADFFQNVNSHDFKYINNIVPHNEQKNEQVSVKWDRKIDAGTLTAWAAYNNQTNYFLTDGTSAAFGLYNNIPQCAADLQNQTGGPLPSPTFYAATFGLPFNVLPAYGPSTCDGYQYQQRDQKDASLELRITSPGDQALRWQAGLYVADIKRHVVVSQGSDPGNGNLLAQAFVPSSGPNPTDLLFDDNYENKVSAVFGNIAYDIQKNLELAFAIRYDNEQRTVDNNVPKVAPLTTGFANPGYINPYYNVNPSASSIPSRSASFSEPEPKLSLNWKFDTNMSAYASYGYGFRSGGFNSSGSAATVQQYFGGLYYVNPSAVVTGISALPVASAQYPNGVSDEYKKEVSKAGEVGLKLDLVDHTVMIDLAAFDTKVQNMQIFNFFAGPFGLLRVVTNIDEATLKGVEGDIRWKTGDYLSLFAGVGTVDSNIDSYSGRPYTAGNKVPYAPEYTASFGADFTVAMGDHLNLVARVDGNSIGKTWFSAVQDNQVQTVFGVPGDYSRTYRAAYTLFNARLGVRGANWDVMAWSRNLANKQYLAEVIPAPEFGGSFLNSGTGRAFGLDVSYRFAGGK